MSHLPIVTVLVVFATLSTLTTGVSYWELFPCSRVTLTATVKPESGTQCKCTFTDLICHLKWPDSNISAPQWIVDLLPSPDMACETKLCVENAAPTIDGRANVNVSNEGMCTVDGHFAVQCPNSKAPLKGKVTGTTPCGAFNRADLTVGPDYASE